MLAKAISLYDLKPFLSLGKELRSDNFVESITFSVRITHVRIVEVEFKVFDVIHCSRDNN